LTGRYNPRSHTVPKVFHAWLWLHAGSLLLSGFKLKVPDALCIKEPGRWIAFL